MSGLEKHEAPAPKDAVQEVPKSIAKEIHQVESETHHNFKPGLQDAYKAFQHTEGNWEAVKQLCKSGTAEQLEKAITGNDATSKLVRKQIEDITKKVAALTSQNSMHDMKITGMSS